MVVTPLEWVLGCDTVARVVENQVHGQSSSSKGSSFDDFKKLGLPYFSTTSDLTETESYILKMKKLFNIIDCFEEQKASYATFMLDKKVVDKSLIVEKDNEEFHQHREQQKKRNKSDGAYNTQSKKRSISTRSQNKGKVVPNSYQGDMIWDCPKNKEFIIGKPKEENKEDKQKPKVKAREMSVDLVLLDLLDFDVILGIDWLASYNPLVDCFGKRVMFHILD
ncbi:hypothetical protein CK203_050796 [Vitis vinifera]|uniref:Uncharacterized protein n=1 Tax=Vitis vinifera TaxID=29760 RepID=A0A438HCJ0_VITVI|nr:hypothetical protein CK203_050796 [Vitis vinifera]